MSLKLHLSAQSQMAALHDDVYEPILIRMRVRDLIRCKSVCKSWHSLISSPRFVKGHLKHSCNRDRNDNEFGYRRIVINSRSSFCFSYNPWFLSINARCQLVGSSNGLVCISFPIGGQLLIANPSTRQVKELRKPQISNGISTTELQGSARWSLCWGFGYDSSIDDYKVVVGFKEAEYLVSFQVLNLNSNVWKVIGGPGLKYSFGYSVGILYNGALHWLMTDKWRNEVIVSFDLSREMFKLIRLPDTPKASWFVLRVERFTGLAIMDDCLCAFEGMHPLRRDLWKMKNYNVVESWEKVEHDWETKNDVVHFFRDVEHNINSPYEKLMAHDIMLCEVGEVIGAHLFVESLVSPHVQIHGTQKRKMQAENSKRTVKLIKGDHSVPGTSARV